MTLQGMQQIACASIPYFGSITDTDRCQQAAIRAVRDDIPIIEIWKSNDGVSYGNQRRRANFCPAIPHLPDLDHPPTAVKNSKTVAIRADRHHSFRVKVGGQPGTQARGLENLVQGVLRLAGVAGLDGLQGPARG